MCTFLLSNKEQERAGNSDGAVEIDVDTFVVQRRRRVSQRAAVPQMYQRQFLRRRQSYPLFPVPC